MPPSNPSTPLPARQSSLTTPAVTTVQRSGFAKADAVRRIVTGVVLDPYAVDLQNDWTPPADVEQTAADWLAKWNMIGADHDSRIKGAQVVESYLFPYPSIADYEAARANKPHNVLELPFGDDVIHSGAWVLSVRLPEDAWQSVVDGSWGAFSIRGFGERTSAPKSVMPQVTVFRIEVPPNV